MAHSVNQQYGAWEVEICVSKGPGASAVALLWPSSDNWDDGELDFCETQGDATAQSYGTYVHYKGASQQVGPTVKVDLTQYHTMRVEKVPGKVTYYLDGSQVTSFGSPLPADTNASGPNTFHLCLQLDQRDGTPTVPVTMTCRAVRVYSYSATPVPVPAPKRHRWWPW